MQWITNFESKNWKDPQYNILVKTIEKRAVVIEQGRIILETNITDIHGQIEEISVSIDYIERELIHQLDSIVEQSIISTSYSGSEGYTGDLRSKEFSIRWK